MANWMWRFARGQGSKMTFSQNATREEALNQARRFCEPGDKIIVGELVPYKRGFGNKLVNKTTVTIGSDADKSGV